MDSWFPLNLPGQFRQWCARQQKYGLALDQISTLALYACAFSPSLSPTEQEFWTEHIVQQSDLTNGPYAALDVPLLVLTYVLTDDRETAGVLINAVQAIEDLDLADTRFELLGSDWWIATRLPKKHYTNNRQQYYGLARNFYATVQSWTLHG